VTNHLYFWGLQQSKLLTYEKISPHRPNLLDSGNDDFGSHNLDQPPELVHADIQHLNLLKNIERI